MRDLTRGNEEAFKAVSGSVKSLQVMCASYDADHFDIARDMANLIHRLVNSEMTVAGIRKTVRFKQFCRPANPQNILGQHLSFIYRLDIKKDADEIVPRVIITHEPLLDHSSFALNPPQILKFSDWWAAPILVAGAADGPDIPAEPSRQIPFAMRKRVSRADLIDAMRNAEGAHYDYKIKESQHFIRDHIIKWYDIELTDGNTMHSVLNNPEIATYNNTFAQAICRHIAFEVIQSSNDWLLVSTASGANK